MIDSIIVECSNDNCKNTIERSKMRANKKNVCYPCRAAIKRRMAKITYDKQKEKLKKIREIFKT